MGSNLPILVLYHHFGWAIPSSAKSRVDEGRPNAFKTRFFDFPHRSETQKHPWNRFYQFRFHTTILGGLLQAVQKAGLTKVVQLRSKRVFSSFPIGAKRKNTLGIEFHEVGFIPPFLVGFCKQRKKPGWRRSSNSVQNSFFRLSPLRRNEESPLESNLPISVSYHHFCRAFASTAKSRVDEGRPIALKTHFFDFPHRCETKKHPWDRIPRGRFHTTIFGGLLQAAQKAGLTKFVQLRSKLVFSTFAIGAKRKNTLGSNSTSSLSYHHFGRALPRSGKRRVDEKRPIALKTRFFEFPHMGETKKHPLDRIPRGRFDTTILGGLFPAAQKAGLTKVVQLRSKLVFWTFPIEVKRKNTLGIEFHEVGFIPPFWVGFSKQRETPVWRRSSNCVENSFFRLSPSERKKKTPLGSNSTRSVSYQHFCWALASSAKRRVDEGRPFALKTRFFDFPRRSETKKHPWDRIPRGRFHTTILGGLYEAAENAGMTKSFQLGWKLVFSTFPIGAKRKNTLGIEFHEVGFIPPFWVGLTKQRKRPGWRGSSSWVENSFCRVPPSGGNKKKPLGSNSMRSVSYHHFFWAFACSAKSRVAEGRPIALKTRFVEFPHRGETKKHPWVRIPRGRFHTTIFAGLYQAAENAGLTNVVQLRSKLVLSSFPIGAKQKKHPWVRIPRGRFHTTIFAGLYQAAENAGLTKVVQLRSKLVLSSFPIGAKRKNTLEIEFHEVGFIPPFWVGFTKERKTPGWRRSSNCVENSFFRVSPYGRIEKTPFGSNSTRSVSHHHFGWAFPSNAKSRVDEGRPIAFKTRFFDFSHRGETKKHPWVRIPGGRFHTPIFAGLYQAAENAGLTKVVQLRSKLVLSSFPIGTEQKNTLGIKFHEVGFIPPFLLGFCKQCKKAGWRMSSNCVENSFFRVSPSGRNEKTPFGSNSTRSASYHHFGWAFPSSAKRRVDEGRPIAFKTRFFDYPHRGKTKKHPWDRIPRGRFHTTILGWIYQVAENAGLTKVVQLRSKLFFFEIPHRGEKKKHPWDRIPRVWFQTTILGRLLQAAQKASCVVHRVQCTVSSAQSTVYRV